MDSKEGSKTGSNKEYEQQIIAVIGRSEFSKLARGYDLIGDIAIIDFKGSKKNEKKIANILMKSNSSINTVLAKVGAVSGRYRLRKLRYIAGKRNFIAEHKENGCKFRFNVRKVYFSNRLSFERSRILKLVKKGENVMVMFAGVGPFAIEIAKLVPNTNVVAIELNKSGYKYMLENIKLNKTVNVKAVLGDVKKKAEEYSNFADRIIMPLPRSSMDFLDSTYKVAKKQAVVHLYAFSDADDPFKDVLDKVKMHSKKNKYKVQLLNKRIVRPYSSNESELVLDYLIKA
jgi:tRNA (guanine37-N1)-methyltransferase